MGWKNSDTRYGAVSITLHWLTLLVMILTWVLIELHDSYKRSPQAAALESWHGVMGLTVGVLVVMRLVMRFLQEEPPIVPVVQRWEQIGAKLMHGLLYLFMLSMPLLGWGILSAEGHETMFWGWQLPPLVARDRAFARYLSDLHSSIGNFGYWLIGLHAAAALYHHYRKHDNTLVRMLPWAKRTD